MLSQVSVCSQGRWVSLGMSMGVGWVPSPPDLGHQEGYVKGVGMSRGVGMSKEGGCGYQSLTEHGIQQDTVGKWAECILLECFLLESCSCILLVRWNILYPEWFDQIFPPTNILGNYTMYCFMVVIDLMTRLL